MRALTSRSYPWSDLDPDRRNSILLIGGISLIVLFALALIGYGYYSDRVAPKHATVVQIGDRKFDYEFLERRVLAEYARGRIDGSNPAQDIFDVLVMIQREELLQQAAKSIDVTATEEEILDRYKVRLVMPSGATVEQVASQLRIELQRTGLSLAEYRQSTIADILERKILAKYKDEAPSESEFVDLRLIKTETESNALLAKERIDGGESFANVAVDLSTDPSGAQNAGDLSWVPLASLAKEVSEAAATIEIGKPSDIIESQEGFFLILASGRERRELSDDDKNSVAQQQVDNLMFERREALGAEVNLTQEQIQRLASVLSSKLV